jgi:hypothetical protein
MLQTAGHTCRLWRLCGDANFDRGALPLENDLILGRRES